MRLNDLHGPAYDFKLLINLDEKVEEQYGNVRYRRLSQLVALTW